MNVEIKEMPARRVGAVRHVGPYHEIGRAFSRLGEIAGPAGLFAQPGAAMIGIYHDNPDSTPPEALRSDAGIFLPENIPLPAGLSEQQVPSGRYATTLHVGPYERLGDAWRLMREWLPANGHHPGRGVSYEIYLNDPTKVPKAELKTQLYIPIA
jgi:AraC family transcriptional regulator